jgi:hypothetical protein
MDFLQYVALELGIRVPNPTKGTLLRALYGFLFAQFEKESTTVLIIDEAHQITDGVLEEVRLLANFETAQQKLLQVLLAGQPELDRKLDSVELRSLKQRIAVRCELEPLRGEEMRRYIQRRLDLAGAGTQGATLFSAGAMQSILNYSMGIPRLINCICDQALMSAYARKVRTISSEIIDDVASRFRLSPPSAVKRTETFLPTSPIARPAADELRAGRRAPIVATAAPAGSNGDSAIEAFGSRQQQVLRSESPNTRVVGEAPFSSRSRR